jgi:putative spermidine/putrescine transport system permease protein
MFNGLNEDGLKMWGKKNSYCQLDKYKGLLGVFPALLFVLFLFVGGLFQSLSLSIESEVDFLVSEHSGRFWAYKELIDPYFLRAIGVSVGIAAVVSLLAGIISLLAAIFLVEHSKKWKWMKLIIELPIGIPHLLAAYLLSQIFMQTGWYARVAFHVGWIDSFEQFPEFIHDEWGIGVVLAYIWKEVPFMVLLIYPFVEKLLREWKETSTALGASFSQTIRWVVVPILLPIWVGGMWVVFAFALGAYEIPALMAQTSFGSIPVMAWQEYSQFGFERQAVAIAMNLVLATIALIVGGLLIYLQLKWYKQGRRVW